ncbi:asialoglycoprotein receptor 1-like [Mixophyes fleayi]|uniref:asialoglycoprotein receptor 1-like n=1 Tax=Mixophyes fleayi TaxID=3061075 RepID=UPI003F4DACDA
MSNDNLEIHNFDEDITPSNSSGIKWWKKQEYTMSREVLQSPHVVCGLSLLYTGLIFIIIILVVAMTNNGVNQTEKNLKSKLRNLNTSLNTKVESLAQDGAGMMEKLKEIELFIKKTLKDTTMMNKLTEIDRLVKRILSDEISGSLQSDVQRILNAIGKLREEIRKENGTQDPLCSSGWRYYGFSCYSVSKYMRPWSTAKKDCEGRKSHLVVINNAEEQDYVSKLTQGITTWIGLTDVDGSWRWVDGTSYVTTPKFWGHIDTNLWYLYLVPRSDVCARIVNGDDWSEGYCPQRNQYICEKKIL